ncbi:MAG: hypothetical protein ACE5F2_01375 [Candidatus Paceibacteria bacterium]
MNLKINKKIIFIFLVVIIFAMNFVNVVTVNAQEETAKEKAQKLYEAMDGDGTFTLGGLELWSFGLDSLGTDENTIFSVLESTQTQEEKNLISKEYKTISGRRLVDDLKGELNDSDYTRALGSLIEGSIYDYSQEEIDTAKSIGNTNIVDSAERTESAKKRGEEVIIKQQQGESIETDAERRIEESRIRDVQKQSVKVFQENTAEQKKPTEFVPLEPIPGVIDAETAKDPSKFFNGLFTFGIAIAGFLAVVMIAVGGIQYMSTDAVSGKGEGRERITYALMGLLLILFSWILLKTINPDILNFGTDALFNN